MELSDSSLINHLKKYININKQKNLMPTTNSIKYGIQSLDFLGSKFKIGYPTLTGKFQTKLGGYLTILMGILSTAFFFIVMSQYFSKDAPVVMTSTESGSREMTYDLYEGNLYLPISVLLGPNAVPLNQINLYVTIKAFVDSFTTVLTSSTPGFKITPFRSFDYKPCGEIDDPKIADHINAFSTLPGTGNVIACPDFKGLEKHYKAVSDYLTFMGKAVFIKVYPCSLPDPSECASAQEIQFLNLEYAYPVKLLKPSNFKNPLESIPRLVAIKIDRRTTKVSKEVVKKNRVFDDTVSLIPAKLKMEYLTLQKDSIDFGMRDENQLHCPRSEVEKGVRGGCQEYISFDYTPSSEVVVTTRNYKKLTTMLGEFGGILKIIATGAFFVYGIYSMRKVKSVLGGIIFGAEEGSQKVLKGLVGGELEFSQCLTKVDKIRNKRLIKQTNEGDRFEILVSRFVSRLSNVDNLVQKLNLLELIERAIFTDDEKKLVPLVLLKSEKKLIEKEKKKSNKKTKQEDLREVQIFGKESKRPQSTKMMTKNTAMNLTAFNKDKSLEQSYQQAFENILHRKPESPFCGMIKDYMVTQLQGTFPEPRGGHNQQIGQDQAPPELQHLFKKNEHQKIELFDGEDSEKGVEEVKEESHQNEIIRQKKKPRAGFMRPTNSPMRIRRRTRTTKQGTITLLNPSRSLLNLKSTKTPPEEHQDEEPIN